MRVDTAAYPGYFVPPYYDSMIAKLIVHARTRELAIARMRRALEVMVIEGIKTTIPLHRGSWMTRTSAPASIRRSFMEQFFERRKNQGTGGHGARLSADARRVGTRGRFDRGGYRLYNERLFWAAWSGPCVGGVREMAYAIIRSGGKQFRVEEGATVRVPSLDKQAGDTVELEALVIAGGEGGVEGRRACGRGRARHRHGR